MNRTAEHMHLPILAITTNSSSDAFALWQSSLDKLQYPLQCRHVVHLCESEPPSGHCTASWASSAYPGSGERWLREVISYVASHQGQRVICAGPGIHFLTSFVEAQHRWQRQMDESSLDLLFVAEHQGPLRDQRRGEVSTIFFIIDSNPQSLQFWYQALQRQQGEPTMAGHAPRGAQFHINSLLAFRVGEGAQDGDAGVRWDMMSQEDYVWADVHSEQDLESAAFQVVRAANQAAVFKRVFDQANVAVNADQGSQDQRGSNCADKTWETETEAAIVAEVDRMSSELASLRQELMCAPQDDLDRHRPSLELAAAELLEEVERLAGDFASDPLRFEAVD